MRYIKPEMEIVELEATDVITTSFTDGKAEGDGEGTIQGGIPLNSLDEKSIMD